MGRRFMAKENWLMPNDVQKIAFVPRFPEILVERDELLENVERLSRHPLLILRAPAGGGKSTVIAAWAAAHPRPGVWIALDRSAADRLGFWRRVVDGIVDAGLVPEGSMLHELVFSTEIANRLPALLLRGLLRAPSPFTLVLDDYHEVADDTVHTDLHWLLEAGAPMQIVIATRALSGLEDPERVARVDTSVLLSNELSFRREEVARVASLFQADEAAAEIHDAFGGWPLPTRAAFVQLGASASLSTAEAIDRVRDAGGRFVVEQADDPEYAWFLLRISVAARLTRELALELGGPESAAKLDRAEREGLGTWSDSARRGEFAIHPYLREQLEQEFLSREPVAVIQVRRAYAADRLLHHDVLEAARQYAAIGDASALVLLLRRYYGELLRSQNAFSDLLDSLPDGELRRHPELMAFLLLRSYARGGSRLSRLVQNASLISAAVSARHGRGKPEERIGLLLSLLTAQRVGGHYDQAVKTAERLVSALTFLDEGGRRALEGLLPAAWVQTATTFFYDEQPQRAEDYFQVATEAAEIANNVWVRLHAASMLDLVLAMRGDLAALAPRLEAARQRRTPSGWMGTYTGAGYHLAEAFVALETFDGMSVRQQLDQLEPHEATIEHWPLLARLRALASLVEQRPYVGLQTLAADIAAHSERPATSRSMSALLVVTRAELLLADGQPHRAAQVLRSIKRDTAAQLIRARIHLALRQDGEALALATPLAWSELHLPRVKSEGLLVVAIAAHRLGQIEDAHAAARRAIALIETFELRRPLAMVPRQDLIAVLDSAGIGHGELLSGIPDLLPSSARVGTLTATELRVLTLLQETGRIDQLASRLFVSANTVKTHLRQIYRKLGVRSREEALGAARLDGLLDNDAR